MTEQEQNTLNDLSYILADKTLNSTYRSMLEEVYGLLKKKLEEEV